MKILLIITHGNVGGATNAVYELASGLHRKKIEVVVGFSEGKYLADKLAAAGIPTHHFRNLGRTHNPLAPFIFIGELRRFVKEEGFDAVQCNSSNTLPACLGVKLANKKIRTVFTLHGLSVLDANYKTFPPLKALYHLFFKFFLRFVDMPVFVSHNDLKEAKRLHIIQKGIVIHNGIDPSNLSFIERDEARKFLGQKIGRNLEDSLVVGSIGRPSYQKNYEFLISAFPEILSTEKEAVALIIGDGPDRKTDEALISKLGLVDKAFITGEILEAQRYLKAFDVFVLTSRYEGLPITLVECLFAGVPVIASAVGGNEEIVPLAGLYDPDNRASFISATLKALQTPDDFIPASSTISQFTREEMITAYLSLLQSTT